MPKKTKSTKGEGKAPQGKGNGNGQQQASGRAEEAKLAGAWARWSPAAKGAKIRHGPGGEVGVVAEAAYPEVAPAAQNPPDFAGHVVVVDARPLLPPLGGLADRADAALFVRK